MKKAPMPAADPRPVLPRLRIGLIVAPRFTLSAFANFVDVLRLAADEGDRSRPIRCEWRILSPDRRPLLSSAGIEVQPDGPLRQPEAYDYIAVVGGLLGAGAELGPDYMTFLREARDKGVPLVGICTGAFILHKAGLMEGYRCCVSWFHHEDFLDQFGGLKPVSDQIFVVDRDRLTCSGGVSSAHLAAFLVDRHVGKAEAQKSLHIMIIDEAQTEEKPQPGLPLELATSDPMVRRALLLIRQRLTSPMRMDDLARMVKVSRRTLERRFNEALGLSPAEAALKVRLSHSRMLLRRKEASITEIATETGFCDASHFTRSFVKETGMTPSHYRDHA